MKNIKNLVWGFLAIAFVCGMSSCRGKQQVSSTFQAFYFETTSLGLNADGSQTVRAYGKGATKDKAIEEAKKNAVSDIIFKGIPTAREASVKVPLVNEVNARERYAEYFDRFFSDGGEYLKFVKESSNKDKSRIESKGDYRVNYGVVVDVDRAGIKRQLQSDGVLR